MPHYLFEGLKHAWEMVRETENSQIIKTGGTQRNSNKKIRIDIHYTNGKIANVNIVAELENEKHKLTDGEIHEIFEDLEKIVLRHDPHYSVIDYTLSHTINIFDGNYSINEKESKLYQK